MKMNNLKYNNLSKFKNRIGRAFSYVFIVLVCLMMIFPVIWLLTAAFKDNTEIFSSMSLIPKSWDFGAFKKGWQSVNGLTYSNYFLNSFLLVIPTVILTVASSCLVAYGFARFHFKGKKILFAIMMGMLLLPEQVLIIPRYLLYNRLGWLDSYKPFIIPAGFATYPFFIYMMVQFFRGIPKELEEAAIIDGCNSAGVFLRVMIPLAKPSIISMALLQFVWRWNDFFSNMLYINSVEKYPVTLALRLSLDSTDLIIWNQVLAMTLCTIIPPVILYVIMQRYVVEGISTTGLKG